MIACKNVLERHDTSSVPSALAAELVLCDVSGDPGIA